SMLMQHVVGVRYLEYYRATIYTMKHSAMSEIAKMNRPLLSATAISS
ncbi:hypothetical protein GPH12_25975, partial [Escherichia coli]|nr:hypothetical protein [Escherichia coli]EFH5650485.1 hypothetical protein [Escherichia coli]EFH7714125.1 hypothetical protein [Escherichia coli]